MNSPEDIRHYFSPVDRLFHTYAIPTANESFGISEQEPVFVFGSGNGSIKGIFSTKDAINHVHIQPSGLFYLVPSKIDTKAFLSYCIDNDYLTKNGNSYSFKTSNQMFSFTTSSPNVTKNTLSKRITL